MAAAVAVEAKAVVGAVVVVAEAMGVAAKVAAATGAAVLALPRREQGV